MLHLLLHHLYNLELYQSVIPKTCMIIQKLKMKFIQHGNILLPKEADANITSSAL